MKKYLPTQPKKRPPGESGQSRLPEEVSQEQTSLLNEPALSRSGAEVSKQRPVLNRQGHTLVLVLVLSVLSYYLFSRFVVTAVIVQGRSMVPTLQDGDRYLLNKVALWFREPRRGDLVVIRDLSQSDFAVKRIVGLPGETVDLRDGQVLINGQPLEEPYLPPNIHTYTPERRGQAFKLDGDLYFVMGDNRPNSEDSRSYGPLSRQRIVGLLVR